MVRPDSAFAERAAAMLENRALVLIYERNWCGFLCHGPTPLEYFTSNDEAAGGLTLKRRAQSVTAPGSMNWEKRLSRQRPLRLVAASSCCV